MSTPTAAAPAASSATPATSDNTTITPVEGQENAQTTENALQTESGSPVDKVSVEPGKEKKATEEKKSNKKKLKLKVDGQDSEEELDLDNEQELIKHLQLSKVAGKRMQEKAMLENQINAFFDLLQKDPDKALSELGINTEDFAVKKLQRKIEEDQKSPEQREKERLQKELEDLRKKMKQDEDSRKDQERQVFLEQEHKRIEEGMIQALDSSGLPNKPLVVKKMAEVMLAALDNNLNLSPSDVAPIVKKELEDDMKEYISALPDEALEAFLGKERLVGMRKKQIAAIKKVADTAASVKQTGNGVKVKEDNKPTKKSIKMSDFLR